MVSRARCHVTTSFIERADMTLSFATCFPMLET
jgi:hypothetical protein